MLKNRDFAYTRARLVMAGSNDALLYFFGWIIAATRDWKTARLFVMVQGKYFEFSVHRETKRSSLFRPSGTCN